MRNSRKAACVSPGTSRSRCLSRHPQMGRTKPPAPASRSAGWWVKEGAARHNSRVSDGSSRGRRAERPTTLSACSGSSTGPSPPPPHHHSPHLRGLVAKVLARVDAGSVGQEGRAGVRHNRLRGQQRAQHLACRGREWGEAGRMRWSVGGGWGAEQQLLLLSLRATPHCSGLKRMAQALLWGRTADCDTAAHPRRWRPGR